MPERDPGQQQQRLEELARRIDEARRRRQAVGRGGKTNAHAAAHQLVLRLLADMGVAMAAGVLLGWGVDSYFGTRPWGVLAGALLGLAAGVRNVLHTADMVSRHGAGAQKGSGTPSINGNNTQDGKD